MRHLRHRLLRPGLAGLLAVSLATAACGDDEPDVAGAGGSADTASVSISSPADGATVTSPVTIEMAATGVDVEPAGEVREGAGHFHVMVDVGCVDPGEVIPSNTEGYHHFGKAQTTAEIELTPGEHTLCLQLADGAHTALDLTDTITVTVE